MDQKSLMRINRSLSITQKIAETIKWIDWGLIQLLLQL